MNNNLISNPDVKSDSSPDMSPAGKLEQPAIITSNYQVSQNQNIISEMEGFTINNCETIKEES